MYICNIVIIYILKTFIYEGLALEKLFILILLTISDLHFVTIFVIVCQCDI